MKINEMRVLKEFVMEFSPFHNKDIVNDMSYSELFDVVKEIVETHNEE